MPKVTPSAIEERAYRIWEREGRPDGRDLDHWLSAEREAIEQALAEQAPHVETSGARSTGRRRGASGGGRRSKPST